MPMLWEKTQNTSARKDSRQGWVVRVSWPARPGLHSVSDVKNGWVWRPQMAAEDIFLQEVRHQPFPLRQRAPWRVLCGLPEEATDYK